MARTANVFARVEPELKEQAEDILQQLGIPMSNAVGMFLKQIVLQKGIPFEMKLPRTEPLQYQSLTKEQFDAEIEKGIADIKAGRVYSARHDIREIYQYIAYHLCQLEAASRQINHIIEEIRSLEFMPMRYKLYEEEPWNSMGLRVLPSSVLLGE